jgi:hypothetical protein
MAWRRLDGAFAVFRNGWDVDGVVTVGIAREALRQNVRDHEVLRTIITVEPDGTPVQQVLDDFEPEIVVIDARDYESQIAVPAAFVDGAPIFLAVAGGAASVLFLLLVIVGSGSLLLAHHFHLRTPERPADEALGYREGEPLLVGSLLAAQRSVSGREAKSTHRCQN